jgi:prefoldin subunit 5
MAYEDAIEVLKNEITTHQTRIGYHQDRINELKAAITKLQEHGG